MEHAQLTRTAIVYDFDGTLAPGNMQEHSFFAEHGLSTSEFWAEVKAVAKAEDADEILVYMRAMLQHARKRDTPITASLLARHGDVRLFDGLDRWFNRLNEEGRRQGLAIDHYVISSGLLEMIRGCQIFDRFTKVFASHFLYNDRGEATWPGAAINYTTKTQFLFRINKGIDNTWDNDRLNRWLPMAERPVPFSRMIFIGDGATDIPSMKTVRSQGGNAIAVFDPSKWDAPSARELIFRLIAEDRAHFVAPADYTEGSQLDITVRGILGRIARDTGFREAGDR